MYEMYVCTYKQHKRHDISVPGNIIALLMFHTTVLKVTSQWLDTITTQHHDHHKSLLNTSGTFWYSKRLAIIITTIIIIIIIYLPRVSRNKRTLNGDNRAGQRGNIGVALITNNSVELCVLNQNFVTMGTW